MTSRIREEHRDFTQLGGLVHVRITIKEVIHGYLQENLRTPATLLVCVVYVSKLRNTTRSVESVRLDCHFAGHDRSEAPVVLDFAPRQVSLVHNRQADPIATGIETGARTVQILERAGVSFELGTGDRPNTRAIAAISGSSEPHRVSWNLKLNTSAETLVPPIFRVAVLLRRSGDETFQCTFSIKSKTATAALSRFRELFHLSSPQNDPVIFDPSSHPSGRQNNLLEVDLNQAIDFQNDLDEPLGPDSKPSEEHPIRTAEGATSEETLPPTSEYSVPPAEGITLEQIPVAATELPTPEKLADWLKLSMYFQGIAAESLSTDAAARPGTDMPPHIWVINQLDDDITVVVSKWSDSGNLPADTTTDTSGTVEDVRFSETSFRGPAARKTLAPYARDCERSSAAFPLWPREDGFGTISIFTGKDKRRSLENDRVPAGAWIYFKQEAGMEMVEYDSSAHSKSSPLFPVTINGWTLEQDIEMAQHSSAESNYILVQSWMPLTFLQMRELQEMDLTLHRYVSKNTYLYHRRGTNLDTIRHLFYVSYADIYRQEYKISGSLGEVARSPTGSRSRIPHEIEIVFHDDVKPEDVRKDIAKMAHLRADTLRFGRHKLRQMIQEQYLTAVASIDAVQVIEEVYKPELRSHIARVILRADAEWNPGDHRRHIFEGDGEVIAVADTGFDSGHISNIHHAFLDRDTDRTRVLSIYPLSNIPLVNDFDGHGTHVCGLAIGSGHAEIEGNSVIEIKGTAPKAKLVVQCLGSGLDGIPEDLGDLFEVPYHNNGARVHSNSWGYPCRGVQFPYNQQAIEIDDFVYGNPDMVICFAAGNDNDKPHTKHLPAQIGGEAAAKNCITVGATENTVQDANRHYKHSSCGPTVEGRIKPDVVAPGIRVLSANSAHKGHPKDPSEDPKWTYMTGTSMATPLVAGCVAVLREALRVRMNMPRPAASLIKALMVNGAVPLERDQSGFGLVDLANSLAVACRTGDSGFEVGTIERQGERHDILIEKFPIDKGPASLKVTLVWSDPPGSLLQNDLDLVVMASDGTERCGNDEDATNEFDRSNNVEQVEWEGIPAPPAKIIISGFRLIRSPQPFACAWRFLKR